jgi:hypothetical protein
VRLQAEPPLRVAQTIVDGARGVVGELRPVHRLQREALEREAREKTSFISWPDRMRSSVPAFGLTQIQSRPAGGSIVPLVSTAIVKPRACSASSKASSTCNSGSPPVMTT